MLSARCSSDGSRGTGEPGYAATVAYVRRRLEAAGYSVTLQGFAFDFTGVNSPPLLQMTAPVAASYANLTDFRTMVFSGNGDVTAPVVAVDVVVPPGNVGSSTSGCEAADFAGFPAGSIALVQRGFCTFRIKAENARAAGATAVVIFNEGNPGRTDVVGGTLQAPVFDLPVVGTSYPVGVALMGPNIQARVRVDLVSETRVAHNVIASSPGSTDAAIVVATRLDGDDFGPGINASSGAAAVLEIARVFAEQERTPRNRVRFVFAGGYAQGLVGARHYVTSLPAAERASIVLALGVDAIGSPNFVRFVFDGDNSEYPASSTVSAGPPGSGEVERIFQEYFGAEALPHAPQPLWSRSSWVPFAEAGIPVGGVFAGDQVIKSAALAATFGGTSGVAFDPCFGFSCDGYSNVSLMALDQLSDAAAHAILTLSRRNFTRLPLAPD